MKCLGIMNPQSIFLDWCINMGARVADKNRAIRKEALREQLSQQKHHEYVIDIANKLHDHHLELEQSAISALKASADIRIKLMNKYIPDLKAVELSQDPENPLSVMTDADLKARITQLMEKLNGS